MAGNMFLFPWDAHGEAVANPSRSLEANTLDMELPAIGSLGKGFSGMDGSIGRSLRISRKGRIDI